MIDAEVEKSPEQYTTALVELETLYPLPSTEAIRADCRWLQERWGSETLAQYRGEHVAVFEGSVVGHGHNALKLTLDLSRKLGLHPQRLVVAYVDPQEL